MKRDLGKTLLAGLLIGVAGCSSNQVGEIIGAATGMPTAPAATTTSAVEIETVNTQQQTIHVRTQNGQTGAARYDERTVVVYRNQQYPVTSLERGDIVLLTLQDVQGTTYVTRVDVQQSVQERTGTPNPSGTPSVMQFSGRVTEVNTTGGTFLLQTASGTVTVSLPYNPPQATLDYFRRLRAGDNVRLEAIPLTNTRVEIYRFL